MTGEPGNEPIQESNSTKAVVYMHDTSMGYFEPMVSNTESVDILREYIEYEAAHDCKRERIGMANARIAELKD